MTRVLELPGLVPAEVLAEVRAGLADATWTDGRATAKGTAREVKRNLQLGAGSPLSQRLGQGILAALGASEAFKAEVYPHTVLPMMFARYEPGMAYGDHVDLPVMATAKGPMRSDLSMTVWLGDPDGYDGGELVVQADSGVLRFKGRAGDAVVYPSTTVHRVDPVTRGARVVAVTWIQSLVSDPEERAVLATLADSLASLQRVGAPDAEVLKLRNLHYRLLRRWAHT